MPRTARLRLSERPSFLLLVARAAPQPRGQHFTCLLRGGRVPGVRFTLAQVWRAEGTPGARFWGQGAAAVGQGAAALECIATPLLFGHNKTCQTKLNFNAPRIQLAMHL